MTRTIAILLLAGIGGAWAADDPPSPGGYGGQGFSKPYSPPCVERENVFEFTEKPKVKNLGNDKYEITFAVKGNCDVTVGIVDEKGVVVRHLDAGVLGPNAPLPFQKNSFKQTIYWNGKDDLDEYHRTPEKLKVRVMLGLKPEFDKRLGGTSPKNLPGYVWGIAIGEEGAFVFSSGAGTQGHLTIRKFDHDANYVAQIWPPPANQPEQKMAGQGYIEYEKGVRERHPDIMGLWDKNHGFSPHADKSALDCQPALIGNRLYFCNAGNFGLTGRGESWLKYVYTDGSTDVLGHCGRIFLSTKLTPWHWYPRLAASPDGKRMYMLGFGGWISWSGPLQRDPVVVQWETASTNQAVVFAGVRKSGAQYEAGSDNERFQNPLGIDCDSQGRVYVSDNFNNRIQVFSPEGKWLKTIPCERPEKLAIHRTTGAIYILHYTRVRGKTIGCLTKFKSFDDPAEVIHRDILETINPGDQVQPALPTVMALDQWTARPRVWLAGDHVEATTRGIAAGGPSVRIWEEDETGWKMINDFDEEAKKEAGANYIGRWSGCGPIGHRTVCRPKDETVYIPLKDSNNNYFAHVFDLKTGKLLKEVGLTAGMDDMAFDKRGYLHCHFNPGFYMPGVARLDPEQGVPSPAPGWETLFAPLFMLNEVPYDYGVEKDRYKTRWLGILPVRDQPGAKFFQDGIGVNMRGDIAVESNIFHIPRMEEAGLATLRAGKDDDGSGKLIVQSKEVTYASMRKEIEEREKAGEQVYFIRRTPGTYLSGATIWTFDRNGEPRDECAVTAGELVNGVNIDEDGKLYWTTDRIRAFGTKPFLAGRAGVFGAPEDKYGGNDFSGFPFTGTLVKTRGKDVRVLRAKAIVPLDEKPARPPDFLKVALHEGGESTPAGEDRYEWVEGLEWAYAGASPVRHHHCSCNTMRPHLDWFKRTFVSEAYRHSFAALDTNGNLILHFGRYGNFDSGSGANSKIPVGGDNIGLTMPRFIGGTDNYLVVSDVGERLAVLKIAYHAEEIVEIGKP